MTRLRQIVEAARQAFVLLLGHRLVRVLAVCVVVAALAALLLPERIARQETGDDLFGVSIYLVGFQFALPTVLTYLGLAALHTEISDRSAVHVFVQPIHRSSLLLGRWIAVASFGALATAAACAAYWVALALPDSSWRRGLGPTPRALWVFVLGASLAAPGYAAVGVFCGATFRRPLVAAVLFVVGWEVMVSNMPPQAGVRGWTVADPVRRMLLAELDPPDGSAIAEVMQMTLRGPGADELGDPVSSVVWFTAVFVLAAALVYSFREYDARARD